MGESSSSSGGGGEDDTTLDAGTLRGADPSPEGVSRPEVDAARYEILRSLGAGAMGVVHLVHDRRLGRDVAMKVIRSDHASDREVQLRFEREARVQGQLEHAAIVPVHDIGTTADGNVFFTMKRVQGESLRAVLTGLRDGNADFVARYGQRRLLGAFSTVCLAVALAHSQGILHRDIKPGNIMFGDFGEVYLLDWGVAKLHAAKPTDATKEVVVAVPGAVASTSKVGDIFGTIGYMAPEQVRGEVVDERADVYSLGATLFEVLTLERLHPRETAAALQSTLLGVNARASERAPGRRVARELEELCVHATARESRDRVASAREMHEVLERVLDVDRDLERRRQLSAEHTTRARVEAACALASNVGAKEARERAIQEVHRAIVLDAGNSEAIEILSQLAREPAGDASGVDEALQAATARMRRVIARTGGLLFLPWVLGVALGGMLGLRHPFVLGSGGVVLLCAAALSWIRTRFDDGWITLGALVCADVAAAICSAAFSPFLIVPGLLACLAVAFTVASSPLHGIPERDPISRNIRSGAIVLGALAFLVPLALEWVGVLPPSLVIRDGAIVLLPRAIDFPPTWTIVFLVGVNLVLILVPAVIASRIRDHALGVEREALASIARLRYLLPSVAKSVIAPDESDEAPRA